jgi:hypothetical protein
MANKLASIIQSGVNNFLTSAEMLNGVATDHISAGTVGTLTNTSGVAPSTGSFAVNAQGSPNMTVAVSSGQAYVTATPTGGSAQKVRVTMDASENVTIAANSTGGTRYDFVYIKVDADKLNNPAVTGLDVVTLITQRSTTTPTDSNGAPANSLLLAIVTVANGASSIANSNIADARVRATFNADMTGWQNASGAWTYASSTTFTVPAADAALMSKGTKIWFDQSGSKYFYVTGISGTTITVYAGTDYTVANATIMNPKFSNASTPTGFQHVFNFTPSWTNLTVGTGGNALNVGLFSMSGKLVHYRVQMIFGSSSPSMGTAPNFIAPITPNPNLYRSAIGMSAIVGQVNLLDNGIIEHHGFCRINSTDQTKFDIIALNAAGTYLSAGTVTATVPFTWAPSDGITVTGSYDVA